MNPDPLYFTPGEFFQGLRLLYNELDYEEFRKNFFPDKSHTDEYVMGKYRIWGQSPFTFWCSIDSDRREMLEFLVYNCSRREAQRNGDVA
mgnify:CR=1 FL=1